MLFIVETSFPLFLLKKTEKNRQSQQFNSHFKTIELRELSVYYLLALVGFYKSTLIYLIKRRVNIPNLPFMRSLLI